MPITVNELGTSGSVIWPEDSQAWKFDFWLSRSPDAEGLVIWNARFRDRLLLYKASLPMIRVQYDNGYISLDRLDIDTAQWWETNDPRRPRLTGIAERFSTGAHQRCLILASYHVGGPLGAYRIMQKWIFYEQGLIRPLIASAGYNENRKISHRHHAYWRLDFDIEGARNDIVLEHFISGTNRDRDDGFGLGWSQITTEEFGRRIKEDQFQVRWAIMDRDTGRGCQIFPGPNDGFADAFARGDLWAMQYHPEEDTHGHTGMPNNEEIQVFLDNKESLDRTDIVLWYCGHIYHQLDPDRDESQEEAHEGGPWLITFRY